MSTITQRKKLSKGSWALIALVIVSIIVIATLGIIGIIDLTFIGSWLISVMAFGMSGWVNAILVLVAPFAVGLLVCYVLYNYIVGQKVTNTGVASSGYAPAPSYPSTPASSGKETTIS